MDPMLSQVLSQFRLIGKPVSCERYGCGHINVTYLVVTDAGLRYILQKINNHVFPNVPKLQENIAAVTGHLRQQTQEKHGVLTLIPTLDGATYYYEEAAGYWRIYDFIEDSICLQLPETPEDFYQSAIAFGTFQQQLKDFPAHRDLPFPAFRRSFQKTLLRGNIPPLTYLKATVFHRSYAVLYRTLPQPQHI